MYVYCLDISRLTLIHNRFNLTLKTNENVWSNIDKDIWYLINIVLFLGWN
jgi:hypothetical protein